MGALVDAVAEDYGQPPPLPDVHADNAPLAHVGSVAGNSHRCLAERPSHALRSCQLRWPPTTTSPTAPATFATLGVDVLALKPGGGTCGGAMPPPPRRSSRGGVRTCP